jgi:ATP-binding cassette subfamily B protein
MTHTSPTSRTRFRQYRRDARAHRTQGTRYTAQAHAKRKKPEHQRSFGQLFSAFWALLRGKRKVIAFSLGTLTIATGLKLVPPAAIGFALDSVLGSKPMPPLVRALGLGDINSTSMLLIIAVGLVLIAFASTAVGISGRYIMTRTTKRIQAMMRRRVFAHAVRLPLHRIHELKSGGAVSILREDAGGVAELLFSMIYNPWRAIIQLVVTLFILTVIDWRLLVGSLVLLPITYFSHKWWIGRIRPLWKDIRATRQDMDAQTTESFGGMRVVRSFGRQRTETNRFIRNNNLMIRQEMLAWISSRAIEVAWAILIPTASAALLYYGGYRILADNARVAEGLISATQALTVGNLVTFLIYLAMLLEPLSTLAGSATAFQNNLAGLDRVLDILDEPRELADTQATDLPCINLVPAQVEGRFVLEDVSFTYPKTTRQVLRNITLDIPAGSTVALVGPSGAGKTTLCNLVARFYDPQHGRIAIDGLDLRQLDVEQYRNLLGIVEQDIYLFDGTIFENIAYGRRGATNDQVRDAAHRAHAMEFIEQLDKGFNTLIGERGVRLSGGQRQRLAIARAILADPRILILDEATSNLDTASERYIQDSLRELLRHRTSFVIAHRLSTIRDADLIVVLTDGTVIETGTHDDLMAQSSAYRDMVLLQTNPDAAPLPSEA